MRTEDQTPNRWDSSRLPGLAVTALVCLGGFAVFGALALASVEFTRHDSRIAAVWIPNAVAVAFLLRFVVAREQIFILALWLGNIAANLAGGDPLMTAAALAACNAIEIQIAIALARQWCGPRPDMQNINHLAKFVGAAAIIAPMVSATLATITLAGPDTNLAGSWVKWAATDGLGMAIIAPGLMVLVDAARERSSTGGKRMVEWCLVVSGGALATTAIFAQSALPLLFVTGPVVLFHAFRLGATGTAVAVGVTASISIAFTSFGMGPVTLLEGGPTMRLIVLQFYLATAFLMGLPVAAMLAGRDRVVSELAEKGAELSLLADSISDAVLKFDADGACTYASRSALAVLGERPEVLIGHRASGRGHPDSRSMLAEVEGRLLEGFSENERFTFRRMQDGKDGNPVYLEADCAAVRTQPGGELTAIVASLRDVTDRVELETQLTRARRIAEDAARGKSQFLANMSHEIRTPMNGVLGFADLLLQAELPKEQRRHAELIAQSGRTMMMLLNDILDLAKIEAGRMTIKQEPTNLTDLIEECVALHRAVAEEKGLALAFEAQSAVPPVLADPLRLRQILLNLLSNAIKFTKEGSIAVNLSTDEDRISISVRDTGIGILPERLGHIFRPFEQGENTVARRYGGTGLGLAISRQLAELIDGYLEVESEHGRGSRFTLSIPFIRASQPPKPFMPQSFESDDNPPLQPSRILLAEDHDVNRMLVTAMLERCGQDVTVARDGEQAVREVLAAYSDGRPFDLVLMDIQMPGCDGYSATRAIRSEGIRASQLPIVALTANAYPEDVATARAAGMQGHLAKPLAFAELVKALQRWLPVRIIDQGDASSPSEDIAEASLEPVRRVHSPDLLGRWKERRREALDAVSAALRNDALTQSTNDELAQLVHKLAGTAGMFGEAQLGERAAAFERALRSSVQHNVRRQLAKELLEIAGTAPGAVETQGQ